MKRITFTFCALVAMSASTHAQSPEAQIAKATLAAPPSMQADTMVIRLAADGNHTILREGSNGLVCWDRSDEPNRSFSVQCSSVENMDRIKQNRAWNMSGKTAEEIRAMRDAAETDGSRKVSKFGSIYYLHYTMYIPQKVLDQCNLI